MAEVTSIGCVFTCGGSSHRQPRIRWACREAEKENSRAAQRQGMGSHAPGGIVWAAGWLRDVAHLDEPSVGVALFALSIAIVPGYFFSGMIVDLLHRRGVRGGRVLLVYGLLFLAIHVPIALNVTAAPKLLWFAYVMFGGMSVVCYALVTRAFAPELAGQRQRLRRLLLYLRRRHKLPKQLRRSKAII